jgi:hypothetical protein
MNPVTVRGRDPIRAVRRVVMADAQMMASDSGGKHNPVTTAQ